MNAPTAEHDRTATAKPSGLSKCMTCLPLSVANSVLARRVAIEHLLRYHSVVWIECKHPAIRRFPEGRTERRSRCQTRRRRNCCCNHTPFGQSAAALGERRLQTLRKTDHAAQAAGVAFILPSLTILPDQHPFPAQHDAIPRYDARTRNCGHCAVPPVYRGTKMPLMGGITGADIGGMVATDWRGRSRRLVASCSKLREDGDYAGADHAGQAAIEWPT